MPFLIFLAVVVLAGLFFASIYNRLVSLRNRYKNAYAQIDVQLKRRYDLIPNLVETAKAYLSHERHTLEAVIAARNAASTANAAVARQPGDASAVKSLTSAEAQLTGSMGKFFALAESYPQLKGDANMRQLTEELTSTENKISFARQAFNDAVMTFNTSVETFPNLLVAGPFNFQKATLFEITAPAEREAVRVSFG
jgi:LemA protein